MLRNKWLTPGHPFWQGKDPFWSVDETQAVI